MGLPFRHKETKVQRAQKAVTTVAALRMLGFRRTVAIAGVGAMLAAAIVVLLRRSGEPEAVPGAPPTGTSAPTPPQNGTSLQDATEQARAAAASLAPQGGDAA